MRGSRNVPALALLFGALLAANAVALEERELRGKNMGNSVAMDGDYAVVGAGAGDSANNHVGCVFVFKRAASDTWTQTAVLTADDGGAYYAFGHSVGISGEWIIVGSRDYGFSNPISHGRVYFFKRNADETWTQKASLGPTLFEQYQDTAAFGASVAIEGDYAVAGDPGYGVDRRGSVTLFQRAGDAWNVLNTAFYQPSPGAVRNLGHSVDISVVGNAPHILAGAPESTSDGLHINGRAFHFWKPLGSLVLQELVSAEASSDLYYGYAVSLDWNDRGQLTAAVGSCLNNDYQGAVYLFDYRIASWSQVAKLARPALADGTAYYGVSVSLRNDVLAVGSLWIGWEYEYGYNAPVWLYYRDQGGPNQWGLFDQVRSQYYDDPTQMMEFGNAWSSGMDKGVALSGNRLIVNAPYRHYLVNGVNTSGAAFVFGTDAASGLRPDVAGVRISEIADNSSNPGPKAAYIELYNPTNVAVSLKDTLLVVERPSGGQFVTGKSSEGSTTDYFRFPPFVTIPSNGFLVVSAGALKDEFEQTWSVDLGTAPYHYEIGTANLHLADGWSYRLAQITRGYVPNPDTTNILDSTVPFPGGCHAVHYSNVADDWLYEDSSMSSPGALDWGQFAHSARALPFREDWSSYGRASNDWSLSSSPKTNWVVNYPDAFAKFHYAPWRSSSFSQAIETPLLSAKGKETIVLGFDLLLSMIGANRGYKVDVQTMMVGGSWNTVASYLDTAGTTAWNGESVDLSPYVWGDYFRVRFLVSGADTSYLNDWRLDNISITATEPETTPTTITHLLLDPLLTNAPSLFWVAGNNTRLHRVYYGTNLLEGINTPLGTFSQSSQLQLMAPPDVNGARAVFFRIQSLP